MSASNTSRTPLKGTPVQGLTGATLGFFVGFAAVALFGPTAPWRTGPFGDGHRVVRLGPACSPCFKRRCPRPHRVCLEMVTVSDVLKELNRLKIRGVSLQR